MASPNISEIITTTLQSRTKKLADNITRNNALLARLNEKGRVKTVSGGDVILQEIEYADNGTTGYYAGYEALDLTPQDVFTSAQYTWKQAASVVMASGLEVDVQNTGKERMIELWGARIRNAEKSMANLIAGSNGIYGDGTASSGKSIGGLQLLVADSPSTGTVGGINRANYSFWRNISFSSLSDGSAAASSSNIQDYMHRVWTQIVRGQDRVDLIPADNNYYRFYWESLTQNQRFMSAKMAELGFESLKYQSADVVLDGGFYGSGSGCPTNHMYFLNTDYIFYRPHVDRNMVVLDPDRFSINQDAIVKIIAWAGNMTASNCSLQGVLKA